MIITAEILQETNRFEKKVIEILQNVDQKEEVILKI